MTIRNTHPQTQFYILDNDQVISKFSLPTKINTLDGKSLTDEILRSVCNLNDTELTLEVIEENKGLNVFPQMYNFNHCAAKMNNPKLLELTLQSRVPYYPDAHLDKTPLVLTLSQKCVYEFGEYFTEVPESI